MFKAIKLASGRFEIYQEDEAGNNVTTFPETFGTPEEANAKLAELNQPTGEAANKPVDSVQKPADGGIGGAMTPGGNGSGLTVEEIQAEADAKIKADEEVAAKTKADEEAANASKSGDEASKTDAEGSKLEPKEGDVCETADGKAGTLRKEGDALVCVVNGE